MERKVITIPRDRGKKSPTKWKISVAFVDFWFIEEEDTLNRKGVVNYRAIRFARHGRRWLSSWLSRTQKARE
jgi:hypothetical protein